MVQLEADLFLGEARESSGYSHIAYDIAEGQRTWMNMGWVTTEFV